MNADSLTGRLHASRNLGKWMVATWALLVGGTFARAESNGYIFVADDAFNNSRVGEYTLSGAVVNASLISYPLVNNPAGLAVSGTDLYVANYLGNEVGKYTILGATINSHFVPQLPRPCAVAVSNSLVYVADTGYGLPGQIRPGEIGVYTTSGTLVNASLISGLNSPWAIAVSGSTIYVANGYNNGVISTYTTSGSLINSSLISGLNNPCSLAISGNDLYVASFFSQTVGKYSLSGAVENASLIQLSGGYQPLQIAVYGDGLYVSSAITFDDSSKSGKVSLYNTSGTLLTDSLITGLTWPDGMVVTDIPEPASLAVLGLGAAALLIRGHGRKR